MTLSLQRFELRQPIGNQTELAFTDFACRVLAWEESVLLIALLDRCNTGQFSAELRKRTDLALTNMVVRIARYAVDD